jgi:thiol-disulfide isomerase/thioredoxin
MPRDESSDEFSDSDAAFLDDPFLSGYTQSRMHQMQSEFSEQKRRMEQGNGQYLEIAEPAFLDSIIHTDKAIAHFYHPDFKRCDILHAHLAKIAAMHPECKFIKISAVEAPFFVSRLKIQTLPTLLYFVRGKIQQKWCGFEGLGDVEDPTLAMVEAGIAKVGAITLDDISRERLGKRRTILGYGEEESDSDL